MLTADLLNMQYHPKKKNINLYYGRQYRVFDHFALHAVTLASVRVKISTSFKLEVDSRRKKYASMMSLKHFSFLLYRSDKNSFFILIF